MLTTDCSCGWEGNVEKLRSGREADHEVWIIFSCPECGGEIARETKNAIQNSRQLHS